MAKLTRKAKKTYGDYLDFRMEEFHDDLESAKARFSRQKKACSEMANMLNKISNGLMTKEFKSQLKTTKVLCIRAIMLENINVTLTAKEVVAIAHKKYKNREVKEHNVRGEFGGVATQDWYERDFYTSSSTSYQLRIESFKTVCNKVFVKSCFKN
jgi:hypothetical protein